MTEMAKDYKKDYNSRVMDHFDTKPSITEEEFFADITLYELLTAYCARLDGDYAETLTLELDKKMENTMSMVHKLLYKVGRMVSSVIGVSVFQQKKLHLYYHVKSIRTKAMVSKIGTICEITDPEQDLQYKGLLDRDTLEALLACLYDYMSFCASGLEKGNVIEAAKTLKTKFSTMFNNVLEIFIHLDNLTTTIITDPDSKERNLQDIFVNCLNTIINIKERYGKSHTTTFDYVNQVVDGLLRKLTELKALNWNKPFQSIEEYRQEIADIRNTQELDDISKVRINILSDKQVNALFKELADKAGVKKNQQGLMEHYNFELRDLVKDEPNDSYIVHSLHDTYLILRDLYNLKFDFHSGDFDKLAVKEKNKLIVEKKVIDKVLTKISDDFSRLGKDLYNMEAVNIVQVMNREIIPYLSRLSENFFEIDMHVYNDSKGTHLRVSRVPITVVEDTLNKVEPEKHGLKHNKKDIILTNIKNEIRMLITNRDQADNQSRKYEGDILTRTSFFFFPLTSVSGKK